MESRACRSKKMIVARFDAGEDLFLSLQKLAEEHGIKAGWFSVIGGLKRFAYGLYENGTYRNIVKDAHHCFELLPTFGNVSVKEGRVLIHCHINAGDEKDGTSSGGHLIEGSKIYPFAEVFMQKVDAEIGRSFDSKTNLWPMKLGG